MIGKIGTKASPETIEQRRLEQKATFDAETKRQEAQEAAEDVQLESESHAAHYKYRCDKLAKYIDELLAYCADDVERVNLHNLIDTKLPVIWSAIAKNAGKKKKKVVNTAGTPT